MRKSRGLAKALVVTGYVLTVGSVIAWLIVGFRVAALLEDIRRLLS
jgi:hypothetical protein